MAAQGVLDVIPEHPLGTVDNLVVRGIAENKSNSWWVLLVYRFKAQGTGESNTISTHQYFISKPYGWYLWSRCMVPLTFFFSCGSSLTPVNVESCVRKVCVLERFLQAIAGGVPCDRPGQLVVAVRSQCAIWEACSQAAILESEHKVGICELSSTRGSTTYLKYAPMFTRPNFPHF